MRKIKTSEIKKKTKQLLIKANFTLPDDIIFAVNSALKEEVDQRAKIILEMILKNAAIAEKEKLPLCQDCGNVYINVGFGQDICIINDLSSSDFSNLDKLLNEAVFEVYKDYYLRKSIVTDPLYDRKNTETNLPAIINYEYKNSEGLKIEVNLKGGGSENCSWLYMLNPFTPQEDIVDIVVALVKENATKACPPIIIGIGIGGSASLVVNLAKKAVFRNLNIRNSDERYFNLENKILSAVNKTGIGPQGLGGKTTALACNIEFLPCHMATMPFAVFFGCHSTRRAEAVI